MKKILIIGGAGFIGSALANDLKDNNFVHILDLKKKIKSEKKKLNKCKLIIGDITEYKNFKKLDKNYDIVFHLAAKTSSSMADLYPEECYKTNIVGMCNLALWANRYKPPFIIFTSSMSVYGKVANNVSETTKCSPISVYGKSKYVGEKIIQSLESKKTKIKILRLFNVYGPDQNFENLKQGMLSIYLAQIFKKGKLTVTGSLKRYRDFIFIDDVITALTECKNFKNDNIFNIGNGIKIKVIDLILLLFKKLNLSSKNKILIKKSSIGDTWGSYANINRAKKYGWKPKTDINLGVEKTLKGIKKFYK